MQSRGGGIKAVTVSDFVVTGDVGDTAQNMAGHIWDYTDLDANLTDCVTLMSASFASSGTLTTDDTGGFTIVNNNAATAVNGILGSGYATNLDGTNQYYSINGLFDTPSTLTNGIVITTWFNTDDLSAVRSLWSKQNTATDEMYLSIQSNGSMRFNTTVSGVVNNLDFGSNWATGEWHKVTCVHNSTVGKLVYVDGVCVARASSATTLISDDIGAGTDFMIGAYHTPSNYYDGKLGQFLALDATWQQRDEDMTFATKIAEPATLTGKEYTLYEKIRPAADASFEYQEPCQVVTKYDSNIYRQGRSNGSTDTVKIVGRV